MRIAVIGDVGGYARHLAHCLDGLGVVDGHVPDDLHVIQVGDLLGGVDDIGCVEVAEPLVAAGAWTQVIGNWDVPVVGGRRTGRAGRLPNATALRRMALWGPALRWVVAVRADNGREAVVSHAGLCRDWLQAKVGDLDAADTAALVNTFDVDAVQYGGELIGEPPPASPLWATTKELWRSWDGHLPRFAQIHGHAALWTPGTGWMRWVPEDLRDRCRRGPADGHGEFFPCGPDSPPIVGIDCSLSGRAPYHQLQPLVLEGVVLG